MGEILGWGIKGFFFLSFKMLCKFSQSLLCFKNHTTLNCFLFLFEMFYAFLAFDTILFVSSLFKSHHIAHVHVLTCY